MVQIEAKHGNGVRGMDVGSGKSFAPLTGQNLHVIKSIQSPKIAQDNVQG